MTTRRIWLPALLGFVVWAGAVSAQDETFQPADAGEIGMLVPAGDIRHDDLSAQAIRFISEGDLDIAGALIEEGLAKDPESPSLRFTQTYLFIEEGREDEAIRVLAGLHREFPGDYRVLNNLAWLLVTAQNPDDRDPERALALIQDALLETADNFHVWSTLSEVHYELGNYARAERAAMEAYRIATDKKAPNELTARYLQQVDRAQVGLSVFELMD